MGLETTNIQLVYIYCIAEGASVKRQRTLRKFTYRGEFWSSLTAKTEGSLYLVKKWLILRKSLLRGDVVSCIYLVKKIIILGRTWCGQCMAWLSLGQICVSSKMYLTLFLEKSYVHVQYIAEQTKDKVLSCKAIRSISAGTLNLVP